MADDDDDDFFDHLGLLMHLSLLSCGYPRTLFCRTVYWACDVLSFFLLKHDQFTPRVILLIFRLIWDARHLNISPVNGIWIAIALKPYNIIHIHTRWCICWRNYWSSQICVGRVNILQKSSYTMGRMSPSYLIIPYSYIHTETTRRVNVAPLRWFRQWLLVSGLILDNNSICRITQRE